MRRLPLTSLLVALLALSGGWAAPLKSADSARLISAIVYVETRDGETRALARPRPQAASTSPARTFARQADPVVTRDLPDALEQRPPPAA